MQNANKPRRGDTRYTIRDTRYRKGRLMSYTNLIYHIVFSTKERRAFLADDYLARTCKYLGGIIRNIEGVPLIVNGMADHVHIAMIASPACQTARPHTTSCASVLPRARWQDAYLCLQSREQARQDRHAVCSQNDSGGHPGRRQFPGVQCPA